MITCEACDASRQLPGHAMCWGNDNTSCPGSIKPGRDLTLVFGKHDEDAGKSQAAALPRRTAGGADRQVGGDHQPAHILHAREDPHKGQLVGQRDDLRAAGCRGGHDYIDCRIGQRCCSSSSRYR